MYVLGGIILPTSDEATVVVATTYDSGEQLIRIDVSIDGDPHLQTASLVVENRGNTPDVAEIGDGLALPTYSPPVISADTNSWTATGTYRETADSLTGDPWTATGRVQEGGPD